MSESTKEVVTIEEIPAAVEAVVTDAKAVTESTDAVATEEPITLAHAYTNKELSEMNFVELNTALRANTADIENLEGLKATITNFQEMLSGDDVDQIMNMNADGNTNWEELKKYPEKFEATYQANMPILDQNDADIKAQIQLRYADVKQTSSFYNEQLKDMLEKNLKKLQFLPDENGELTIPNEHPTNYQLGAIKSLTKSMEALEDRPAMNYMVRHCTNRGALINTWKGVRKDYQAADAFIIHEMKRLLKGEDIERCRMMLTLMSNPFYARMAMYQIARLIKHGEHDGTDMYGRVFLLNISDYAMNRYDLGEDRLLDVCHTILQAYVDYSEKDDKSATFKRYLKTPAGTSDAVYNAHLMGETAKRLEALEQANIDAAETPVEESSTEA